MKVENSMLVFCAIIHCVVANNAKFLDQRHDVQKAAGDCGLKRKKFEYIVSENLNLLKAHGERGDYTCTMYISLRS